jgi:hypothetical protein
MIYPFQIEGLASFQVIHTQCRMFYQDGTIGYEIKLTGELSTNLLAPGGCPVVSWPP